jgi:hypothetical protein
MDHAKLMLAEREGLGSICQCACGYVHLTYGPAMLTLSTEEFFGVVEMAVAARQHMQVNSKEETSSFPMASSRTQ